MTKKNIILIHGWGARADKLLPLEKCLTVLGWSVKKIKLPGFDLANPLTSWGMQEYADYVLAKIKKYFGLQHVYLYGHSFGGKILLKLMSGKNSKNIKGIILNSPSGLSRDNVVKRYLVLVVAKTIKLLLFIPLTKDVAKKLYDFGQRRYYSKAKGIMKHVFQRVVKEDLKPNVAKIKIPSLVLWGKDDTLTPVKDAFFLQRSLKKSSLVIVDNDNHLLPYNNPKIVAQKIDQWQKTLS